MMSKILIIDNEESIRYTFASFLEDEGHTVVTTRDYREALPLLDKVNFDLICVGLFLGNDTGIDDSQPLVEASGGPVDAAAAVDHPAPRRGAHPAAA